MFIIEAIFLVMMAIINAVRENAVLVTSKFMLFPASVQEARKWYVSEDALKKYFSQAEAMNHR
jgi:hypothetical protein